MMNTAFTTNQILLFIGAAQGLGLAILLLTTRKANKQANRFLAAILVVFCINITMHTVAHGKASINIPHHSAIITLMFLVFGPFFYFYVKTLTAKHYEFTKKQYLHFLPFIICCLILIPLYFMQTLNVSLHLISDLLTILLTIHLVIYMSISLKLLVRHSKNIKETHSSIDRINLRWLRFLLIIFTITWILALYFDTHSKSDINWDYMWLLVSFVLYLIGYMGFRHPHIFSGDVRDSQEITTESKKKYGKSSLTDDLKNKYLEKLKTYMASEKPYLRSDLTLPELAGELSISVHHLSQIINENLDKNFFEFINHYRVDEAKSMLSDAGKKHLSIAAIGFDAGFNSNSSFNSVFKNQVKMTPSQFRNSKNI